MSSIWMFIDADGKKAVYHFFLVSWLLIVSIYPFTHTAEVFVHRNQPGHKKQTLTDRQRSHQEQTGVSVISIFVSVQTRGARFRRTDPLISRRPVLPPEAQLPKDHYISVKDVRDTFWAKKKKQFKVHLPAFSETIYHAHHQQIIFVLCLVMKVAWRSLKLRKKAH